MEKIERMENKKNTENTENNQLLITDYLIITKIIRQPRSVYPDPILTQTKITEYYKTL
jgi:hypothetical protein